MRIFIAENPLSLGKSASAEAAKAINRTIKEKGKARIILSTGMSQFETLSALVSESVDWSKVEMFHLDEYCGLPESHIASFRRYLKERFISKVELGSYHLVGGTESLEDISYALKSEDIDLGLIGIGENGHIAFNDPPCDFYSDSAYITVMLNEECRNQQVREGWFKSPEEVPEKAISMTPHMIMKCRTIISAVPYSVKASAIRNTLESHIVTNMIPATLLKTHSDFSLFLDKDSAGFLDIDKIIAFDGNTIFLSYI